MYALSLIHKKQLDAVKRADMLRIVEMECEAVKAVAYTEFCGVNVDIGKLSEVAMKFNLEAAKSKEYLVKLILKTNNSKYIDSQLNLFDDKPVVSVNFEDTESMKEILKDIGGLEYADYSNSSENADLGWLFRSTTKSSKIINEYSSYLSCKRKSKLCKNLIRATNPKTKRIHTSFLQINKTGRMSTGGKSLNHPNIMGIDKDLNIRKCFTAESGNKLSSCDYDNMEYYIYAELADDINIKTELKLNSDGHSEVARVLFDKELQYISNDGIKNGFSIYRDAAKTIRFIVLNGGDGRTISKKFGCSSTQGNKIYNKYKEAFNIDDKLASSLTLKAIFNGHIDTDPLFGGKCYLDNADKYVKYINKYSLLQSGFWDKYRNEKGIDSDWYNKMKPIVADFSKYKKSIKVKSLNYLIQGTGSNIFKIALIHFFNKVVEENMFGKVLITNLITDEIVIEAPNDIIDYWAKALEDYMILAGETYCTEVSLGAKAIVSDYWSH